MHEPTLAQQILIVATKFCFLILREDTSFFFLLISLLFFFLLFYVIINFYKNYFIIIIIFFHENYFYFFMFRYVPKCSGMFRNVPCSGFYRRPISIGSELEKISRVYLYSECYSNKIYKISFKKRLRNCPQAMDKTPRCAVDKYMSKISKILTCSKKFKDHCFSCSGMVC